MKERTIKLTLDESDRLKCRHVFLVTLSDNGAEIRGSGSPVVSRDSSVSALIGIEPQVVEVLISVEEVP